MELKLDKLARISMLAPSSNRTFMELKHGLTVPTSVPYIVLIAPLWN